MKKPEKQVPLCPLIQSECVEEGCKFWLQMERRNITTQAVEKYQECAFVVQIGVITENSMSINRMVSVLDRLRGETENLRIEIKNTPGKKLSALALET